VGLPRAYDNKINFEGKFEFLFPINSQRCLHIAKSTEEITFTKLTELKYGVPTEEQLRRINVIAADSSVMEIYGSCREIVEMTRDDLQSNRFLEKMTS